MPWLPRTPPTLFDTMHSSISCENSTPQQNRQLGVLIGDSKQ